MTLMRDGSCWPGTIRMREPYLGPYGQLTEGVEYISKRARGVDDERVRLASACG